VRHFLGRGYQGKAMVVAIDKMTAVRLYDKVRVNWQAERARVVAAFRLALSRSPTRDEAEALTAYAEKHGLANACRVLFNMNEFAFID